MCASFQIKIDVHCTVKINVVSFSVFDGLVAECKHATNFLILYPSGNVHCSL